MSTTINGTNGNDVITVNSNGNLEIDSGNGNDKITITGMGNNDVDSGNGNDIITITGNGNNDVDAGNGDDVIIINGNGNNDVDSGNGNDIISITGNGDNTVDAGNGDDTVTISGNGYNYVDAGNGNDQVSIIGTGASLINGGSGDDILKGGSGSDLIFAGAGDDIVYFSQGTDIVSGGTGNDTFIFGKARAAYDFESLGLGIYSVKDIATGAITYFSSMEVFKFTDVTMTLSQALASNGTTNHPAVIGGVETGNVTEDVVLTASGQLTVADPDPGQNSFQAVAPTAGTYGTFSMNSAGLWSYSLNNAAANVQALAAGQQVHDTFTIKSADGTQAVINVTVTGTNDAAVITGTAVGAVKEDVTLSANGVLNVSDADTGQSAFQVLTNMAGTYGSFSIDASGHWTYNLNNAAANVQSLAEGVQVHDTFTVMSLDGSASQVVNITVTGTNDAAVISGTAVGAVKEDVTLSANGVLNVSDVDTGQSAFQVLTNMAGTYGSFSIDASGHWTYNLNNAAANVQSLAEGVQVHDTFTVMSLDGSASQVVNITVTGTNDAAVITGNAAGSVTEDATLTASGQLNVSDVDTGQSAFQAVAAAGTYGTFSMNAAGAWTYTLDNTAANVQALNTGQQVHDTFTVYSQDGSASQVVDVTINGTDEVVSLPPLFTNNTDNVAFNLVSPSSVQASNDGTFHDLSYFDPNSLYNSLGGNDTVAVNGAGYDTLSGYNFTMGNGNDSFSTDGFSIFSVNHNTIAMGDGANSINLAVVGNAGSNVSNNTLTLGNGDDFVRLASSSSLAGNSIAMGDGNDTLIFNTPGTIAQNVVTLGAGSNDIVNFSSNFSSPIFQNSISFAADGQAGHTYTMTSSIVAGFAEFNTFILAGAGNDVLTLDIFAPAEAVGNVISLAGSGNDVVNLGNQASLSTIAFASAQNGAHDTVSGFALGPSGTKLDLSQLFPSTPSLADLLTDVTFGSDVSGNLRLNLWSDPTHTTSRGTIDLAGISAAAPAGYAYTLYSPDALSSDVHVIAAPTVLTATADNQVLNGALAAPGATLDTNGYGGVTLLPVAGDTIHMEFGNNPTLTPNIIDTSALGNAPLVINIDNSSFQNTQNINGITQIVYDFDPSYSDPVLGISSPGIYVIDGTVLEASITVTPIGGVILNDDKSQPEAALTTWIQGSSGGLNNILTGGSLAINQTGGNWNDGYSNININSSTNGSTLTINESGGSMLFQNNVNSYFSSETVNVSGGASLNLIENLAFTGPSTFNISSGYMFYNYGGFAPTGAGSLTVNQTGGQVQITPPFAFGAVFITWNMSAAGVVNTGYNYVTIPVGVLNIDASGVSPILAGDLFRWYTAGNFGSVFNSDGLYFSNGPGTGVVNLLNDVVVSNHSFNGPIANKAIVDNGQAFSIDLGANPFSDGSATSGYALSYTVNLLSGPGYGEHLSVTPNGHLILSGTAPLSVGSDTISITANETAADAYGFGSLTSNTFTISSVNQGSAPVLSDGAFNTGTYPAGTVLSMTSALTGNPASVAPTAAGTANTGPYDGQNSHTLYLGNNTSTTNAQFWAMGQNDMIYGGNNVSATKVYQINVGSSDTVYMGSAAGSYSVIAAAGSHDDTFHLGSNTTFNNFFVNGGAGSSNQTLVLDASNTNLDLRAFAGQVLNINNLYIAGSNDTVSINAHFENMMGGNTNSYSLFVSGNPNGTDTLSGINNQATGITFNPTANQVFVNGVTYNEYDGILQPGVKLFVDTHVHVQ